MLENFDDEVRDKLRVRNEVSKAALSRYEQLLMQVTRFELADHAQFLDDGSFQLRASPFLAEIPVGLYELPRRSGDAHFYRLNHPLAQAVVTAAKSRQTEGNAVDVAFDLTAYKGKVSALEPLRGRSGWLQVTTVAIESLDQGDHLLEDAFLDAGIGFAVLPFRQRRKNLAVVTDAEVMIGFGASVTRRAPVEHREHFLQRYLAERRHRRRAGELRSRRQ